MHAWTVCMITVPMKNCVPTDVRKGPWTAHDAPPTASHLQNDGSPLHRRHYFSVNASATAEAATTADVAGITGCIGAVCVVTNMSSTMIYVGIYVATVRAPTAA